MGDKSDATSNPPKPLHPVYIITDIQPKVRVLNGVKVSYSSWVKLFQLHARGYKVMSHIDGTRAPGKEDPDYAQWSEIDAIVLQWIYRSLSDDLSVRVLDSDSTTFAAWTRIKSIFLNNKGARAAALEHEFNNLTLKSMPSLESHCQKLKDLAGQLNDLDCLVNDQGLVLQLVRGLPVEYDVVGAYINQSLPTWETACSMLQLEHQHQTARENLSTPTALAAVTNEPQRSDQSNRRRGGSRTNNSRRPQTQQPTTSWPRGKAQPHHQPQTQAQPAPWSANRNTPPYWAYWAPPPCPFPTQSGWAQPWATQSAPWGQTSNHGAGPSKPPGFSQPNEPSPQAHLGEFNQAQVNEVNGFDPLQPTQIGEALHAMTMNTEDAQWFMDSGATDHLTEDQGIPEWEDHLPPQ